MRMSGTKPSITGTALANENKLKEKADYAAYKESADDPLPKFKYNGALIRAFKEELMPVILPLIG